MVLTVNAFITQEVLINKKRFLIEASGIKVLGPNKMMCFPLPKLILYSPHVTENSDFGRSVSNEYQ